MPDEFDWRERLLTDVAGTHRRRVLSFQVKFTDDCDRLLSRAAAQRGCTTGTYAKRAVQAMMAHDLGLDFAAVWASDPEGRTAERKQRPDSPNAFGGWAITGVEEV